MSRQGRPLRCGLRMQTPPRVGRDEQCNRCSVPVDHLRPVGQAGIDELAEPTNLELDHGRSSGNQISFLRMNHGVIGPL